MRFAIYFTPPADDALTCRAAEWLGRDAFSNSPLPLHPVPEFSTVERENLVRDPRRYGFHATLKAPFELAPGMTRQALLDGVRHFAAGWPAFAIPRIVLGQLGPFFALVPEGPCAPLQDFADEIVRRFEDFRASLGESDIARRKPERLAAAQRENLMRWGYPYVFDQFRFHMTLTGPVAPERQDDVRRHLEDEFLDFVNRPLAVRELAVFEEEERGAPFRVCGLFPLAQDRKEAAS